MLRGMSGDSKLMRFATKNILHLSLSRIVSPSAAPCNDNNTHLVRGA